MTQTFLARFYQNHVLANLLFVLVLVMGALSYFSLPREQDPSINFNWIQVTTIFPGASAEDVEKLVTDPIEDALRKISDVRFVSSNSRESVSSILVRFNDLDSNTFDKRVNDVRREIQSKERVLPAEVESPHVLELTTANAYPSATLVVIGQANDEQLRQQAQYIIDDIERLKGVDRVESFGLHDPEIQIHFNPKQLIEHGINPADVSNTIFTHYRDISAGTTEVGQSEWLVRWVGKDISPHYIGKLPIVTAVGELPLEKVAEVRRGREKVTRLVDFEGKPSVMLSVMKQESINTLKLVDTLKSYIDEYNERAVHTGIRLQLMDDQTEITKSALSVMQNNAIVGLFLVLGATWLFLGTRIAIMVSIGIPFTLAGTFWVLKGLGQTLNVTVLLGTVITLGMLVDDSVVVVEGIYYRLSRGMDSLKATLESLKEVFAPVTTSVLTTTAAFVPLMLLPGILGKFMMVIPLVVTIALLISLVEAYWMLPAHINSLSYDFNHLSKTEKIRAKATHWIRVNYVRALIYVLKRPKKAFAFILCLMLLAIAAVSSNLIHKDFFASDPLRLFYVNVEMPAGSTVENTLDQAKLISDKIKSHLSQEETRSVVAYSGLMFTEMEPFLGDQYGQVLVSLNPQNGQFREVDDVIESMRSDIIHTPGPLNISFLRLSGGPPTSKPINVKVRGNRFEEIRPAVKALRDYLGTIDAISDISDNDSLGRKELLLKPNLDAINRADLDPQLISRIIRLWVDGEVITSIQDQGEKVDVRVQAKPQTYTSLSQFLNQNISLPNEGVIQLSELVYPITQPSMSNIRHYDFRRTITVEADTDKERLDTVEANQLVRSHWDTIRKDFPNVTLEFSGELDDIEESINAIPILFLFGIGVIYLILGTQFKSYWQPLMILSTVPLAFTGVTFGLLLTRNPLSLYTLYGIVALSGITVNAAIVLISAANQRLEAGMSLDHATIYAARRRIIPILITSITTIAGLFSLAAGLGGRSLIWGPVATSIVWGLFFSTSLALFLIPLLYRLVMVKTYQRNFLDKAS